MMKEMQKLGPMLAGKGLLGGLGPGGLPGGGDLGSGPDRAGFGDF